MAVGRKFVGFNADISGAAGVNAFLQQVSLKMNTPAHIGSVLKYAHAEMSQDFDTFMAAMAPNAPSRFHHVYEWNQIGNPDAQLWKNVLRGGGNNRIATFEWRASKSIVPVRDPLPPPGGRDGGPRATLNSGNRPKAIHVFVWKAPVMEYGKTVTVGPKRGKFIVYYTGPVSQEDGLMYQQVRFSREAITVKNPGGTETVGAFTKMYVDWWSKGGGQHVMNTTVKSNLSNKTSAAIREGLIVMGQRSRMKSINMGVMGNVQQATAAGRAAANKMFEALQANYIEQAKAREAFLP